MVEILSRLLDFAKALSPVAVVRAWEVGLYMIAGKYRGTVGPGLKLLIPGLCEIIRVSVVPEVYQSDPQTVVMRDGRLVTFTASVSVVVRDARKAWLEIGHYAETVQEIVAGVLAEEFATAKPDRFEPEYGKRARLLADLRERVNASIGCYGIECLQVWVNNFIPNARPVRLLLDRTTLAALRPQQGG